MVSTIASMGVLITANVAPAIKSMDEIGKKVKDVGQTAQVEGTKTSAFMKQWAGAFAAIGAAATGALYMVIKASPLLSGAMSEAKNAISLLFMTVGDALESILRPFVDLLWGLVDVVTGMPAPLNSLTAAFIVVGGSITAILGGLVLLPTLLHAVGLASGAAASGALLLSTAFAGIITVAGLVAAALYYVSGDPTVAIVGAFTTIGIGATILLHNPVILAITMIVNAFILMATSSSNLQTAVAGVFLAIGVAATALMGHPLIAAFTAVIGTIALFVSASDTMKVAIIAVFTAIGIAASVLLANPVIAAITAIIDAIVLLISYWDRLTTITLGGIGPGGEVPGFYGFQQGGYVPYTGPAIVHAGEYVVPAGKVAAVGRGGPVYHITNQFDIHDVTLAGDMDIDRLVRKLDDHYKREMERVA